MLERKINIALEDYRKRWGKTCNEMANILQEDWGEVQYKKYILGDRLEAVKAARICKLLNWPFPDPQILTVRGQIGAKIKAELFDADIKVRQAIRRVLKIKKEAEQKYMNQAYQFLNEGFSPIWVSIFYMALRKPVVPFGDFLNNTEKEEMKKDIEDLQMELFK